MAKFPNADEYIERMRELEYTRMREEAALHANPSRIYGNPWEDMMRLFTSMTSTESNPTKEFEQLKKSVRKIEAEPFTFKVRQRIEAKINRLQSAGAVAQATILEQEISTRESLNRLKEWDYKVLPKKTLDEFTSQQTTRMRTSWADALQIHIDPIEKYCGNPKSGEAKNRIIPDNVLDKLEDAKERELFDEFQVLWAEKVKDPLLLGIVYGCEDYFLICEWGDDVTFDQIMKGKG